MGKFFEILIANIGFLGVWVLGFGVVGPVGLGVGGLGGGVGVGEAACVGDKDFYEWVVGGEDWGG